MKLKEGKDVGYWLNEIQKRVISGELDNNKSELIQWLKDVKSGKDLSRRVCGLPFSTVANIF